VGGTGPTSWPVVGCDGSSVEPSSYTTKESFKRLPFIGASGTM